jgi:sensor c-di-GMP phosphodiesterase-like protein
MLKLGVDIIKIDKMFIDSLGTDRYSNTIIQTLIDLAQNMRMDVIAEGVESFVQVLHLRDLGIRAAQGFVFSPPLSCSASWNWLRRSIRSRHPASLPPTSPQA